MARMLTYMTDQNDFYRAIRKIGDDTYAAFAPAKMNISLRVGGIDPQTKPGRELGWLDGDLFVVRSMMPFSDRGI